MGATEEFFRNRCHLLVILSEAERSRRTPSRNKKLHNKSTDRQASRFSAGSLHSVPLRCTPLGMTGGAVQSDKSLAASLVRGKVYARLQPEIPA